MVFTLNIIAPNGPFYQASVKEVILPAVDGPMGILPYHAEIIAALSNGDIRIKSEEFEEKIFTIESGYVKFTDNVCTILAII